MILFFFLLALAFFIILSGILSASETALFSLPTTRVQAFKKDPTRKKRRIARLLERPRELLVTILMVNVAVNILVQNIVSNIFGDISSWLLTVGIPLVLTLLFGEVIPKSIAISHNVKVAGNVATPLYILRVVLGPFRVVFTLLANNISRICFAFLRSEPEISADELKHALKRSREFGALGLEESKLIKGALDIDETIVKELMRPKEDILFYEINEPTSKLVDLFVDEEVTRLPLVDTNIDTPLGVITSDIYFLHANKIKTGEDCKRFAKECFFVPELISARTLLGLFDEKKETIALAVDEYGTIVGLITYEDIVEVVIGEVDDKRDEKPLYTKAGNDVIITSGKLEVVTLEEIFDVSIDNPGNKVTLGGLLTEKEGSIPQSGVKVIISGLLFHVLGASLTRVTRIYIRNLKPVRRK